MSSPTVDWYAHADVLLKDLIARHSDEYGLGTMSPSIYDTAWVSLVSRNVGGHSHWVFPESFQYIYEAQNGDGGWSGDGSTADAVINTLACLLSLIRHKEAWLASGVVDIVTCIDKATAFLHEKLPDLDVLSTERIAFEVVVPSLLDMLEEEGIKFDFPQLGILRRLNQKKLAKINFEMIYAAHTTLLHSLEAFVGKLDFDRVAHLKRGGNLMASPSSTAAYLMSASTWDEEAEQYLRHVLSQCKSTPKGAVPNVWPTTVFEFSWVCLRLAQFASS